MFGLSFWEIALIMVVALVVLGPKRLPDAARTLGRGLRSLRRASSDIRSVIEEPLREVREPLQEMRDDIYEAVNSFGDDVVESVRDVGAESKELEEGEGEGEGEEEESDEVSLLAAGEESELEDGRRIASTDPFGASEVRDDGLGEQSGPSLLAAGPSPLAAGGQPELQEGIAPAEEVPAEDPPKGGGASG